MAKFPDGETQSVLLREAGLRNGAGRAVLGNLVDIGRIEACAVMKRSGPGSRRYRGYRLVAAHGADVGMELAGALHDEEEEAS